MKIRVVIALILLLSAFVIISCESDSSIEFKRYYTEGAQLYQTHCQNCHGAHGEGLLSLIPPLTDSVYFKNNKATLACSIRFGLKDPIVVGGKGFVSIMPRQDISPIELAEVITYVQNSFGNKLGLTTLDQVQADMSNCR
ncbi:MAG TPA: c-type cytochrome [Mucilaginibacter sp.]|jgi:mono/diheme cytochrome c family protein|nr:c-type cytochrome [Mucilaginibacter sp.]